MNIEPKSRQQKLVDAMFAYFGDMTNEVTEDSHTLRISSDLLTLGDELMGNDFILSFIDLWNCEYPEEEEVSSREVIWALNIFNTNMTQQIQDQEQYRAFLASKSSGPNLRVINGGLSANPDRPYVAPQDIEHEYDMDF